MLKEIEVEFKGETKKIPEAKLMRLIDEVWGIIPLFKLAQCVSRNEPPLPKISMAQAAMLRCAGFEVSDLDVWREIGASKSLKDAMADAAELMTLMTPPAMMAEEGKKPEPPQQESKEAETKT